MSLSDKESERFEDDLHEFERKKAMPYITSIERSGIKKGREQGREEALLTILSKKFGPVPEDLGKKVSLLRRHVPFDILCGCALDAADISDFEDRLEAIARESSND